MPNFNALKSTNPAYFGGGAAPSWNLATSVNPWDAAIDYLALVYAWNYRAEATAAITVGSNPFVYTAGTDSEVVYIFGGTVTLVEKQNGSGGWVSLGTLSPVWLAAGQQIRVTYSSLPTMKKDVVGAFNNATGSIAAVTVTASPFTFTNDTLRNVQLIVGADGVVTSIVRNGVNITDALPLNILLPPGGSVVITYTSAPTIVLDR